MDPPGQNRPWCCSDASKSGKRSRTRWARARTGSSAVLALVGEPGIGKTALLDHAAEAADGLQVLRARGIESEAEIPFASLLELLRPALGRCSSACPSHSRWRSRARWPCVRGRRSSASPSVRRRSACSPPTPSEAPVAVLIDDAQWLDGSSAQALLFALRRLVADPIAVFIAVREGEPSLLDGADLPALRAGRAEQRGGRAAARWGRSPSGRAAACARRRETRSPCSSWRRGAGARPGARGRARHRSRPASRPRSRRRVGSSSSRPPGTRCAAATSDTGDLPMLERAAARIGVDLSGLEPGERGRAGRRCGPGGSSSVIRSPARRSTPARPAPAPPGRIERSPAALPDLDIDRRAWHLASAAAGADRVRLLCPGAGRSAQPRAQRLRHGRAAGSSGRRSWPATRERSARLPGAGGDAIWLAGLGRARARAARRGPGRMPRTPDGDRRRHLAGQIAIRRGPVMRGYEILVATAEHADPGARGGDAGRGGGACFYAGDAPELLAVAERARAALPADASARSAVHRLRRARDRPDRRRRRRRRRGGPARGDRPGARASPEWRDNLELLALARRRADHPARDPAGRCAARRRARAPPASAPRSACCRTSST